MSRLNIAVAGMVAGDPGQGGATWAVLQYVLGLRRLGHNVTLVEAMADRSVVPTGSAFTRSTNARYFSDVVRQFGLTGDAGIVHVETRQTVGLSLHALADRLSRCDLVLNIAGNLREIPELFETTPLRLYLDLDPAFTQLWNADGIDMRWAGHTHYATVGLRLADSTTDLPLGGIDWFVTLPPVVLDIWRAAPQGRHVHNPSLGAYTTVANWRSYGSIERNGRIYGQKVHSWRALMELPLRTGLAFTPAISIHPDEVADLERLKLGGWQVLPAEKSVATPDAYMAFIRDSRAEIGIAKSGYVLSRCGWFSERSACYLAAGRPVLAQETGFAGVLPVGEGLLSFSTLDDAIEGVRAIEADYVRHAGIARELAGDYFDSARVLSKLLAHVSAA